MKVTTWMRTELSTLSVDATIQDAVNLVVEKRIAVIPVLDGACRFAGVVTARRILSSFVPGFIEQVKNIEFVKDYGLLELSSEECLPVLRSGITGILQLEPYEVAPDCTTLCAISIMARFDLNTLFVVEERKLLGAVSFADLCGSLLWHIEQRNFPGAS